MLASDARLLAQVRIKIFFLFSFFFFCHLIHPSSLGCLRSRILFLQHSTLLLWFVPVTRDNMAYSKIKPVTDENHFQDKLYEYPELENYVGNFQVDLKSPELSPDINTAHTGHLKDFIVVFKRKSLTTQELQQKSNIYSYDLSNIELDALDANKALSSCIRCRKFKKKCTRDLPECLNCGSCDELCIYTSRKRKGSVAAASETSKRARGSPLSSRKSSVDSRSETPFDTRRRFSMPVKLSVTPLPQEQNYCHYESKGGSDLYRLLN